MSAASVTQRLAAGLGRLARLRSSVSVAMDLAPASAGSIAAIPAFVGKPMCARLVPVTTWPTYARNIDQSWDAKPTFTAVIKHHDRLTRRPLERSP